MVPTLLCPHHVSPFAIFAGGLVTLVALALVPASLYRIFWVLRYHRGAMLRRGVRLRGRIVGPPPVGSVVFGRGRGDALVAETFELETAEGEVLVCPEGALLRGLPRRVRVGDRVTVDGFPEALDRQGERLYRQQGGQRGVRAVQVIRGTWPALHWLLPAMVAVVVLAVAVIFASIH